MLARGEDVLATDISQSLPPNLSELAGKDGFHYRSCDVRKASEVSEAFPPDVQVIYHMASAVGVDQYINDPIGTIDSVFIGTRNVLV